MESKRVVSTSGKSLLIGPAHRLDPSLRHLLERTFLSRAVHSVPGRLTETEMEEVDWLVIAGAALTGSEQEKLARWLGRHSWSGLIVPEQLSARGSAARRGCLSGSASWPKTPDRDVAPAMDKPSAPLRVGPFVLDVENHTVSIGGEELYLRPMEYLLLAYFLEYPNRLYHREELVGVLWGSRSQVDVRTVDTHVARLRKALMVQGQGRVIETVFRFGYRFRPERALEPSTTRS